MHDRSRDPAFESALKAVERAVYDEHLAALRLQYARELVAISEESATAPRPASAGRLIDARQQFANRGAMRHEED